jgi:chromosome segregation ATPase
MTSDEFNRKMEFIVEQQAQFATDIQRLAERQERFQIQIEALNLATNTALEMWTKTAEAVTQLLEAQARTDRQIAKIGRQMAETDRRMAETDRHFARTERQIDRVAKLIEAHVREGHPPDAPTG